jgi:hypothetical protein
VHKENFPESANLYKQMLKKNLGLEQFGMKISGKWQKRKQ